MGEHADVQGVVKQSIVLIQGFVLPQQGGGLVTDLAVQYRIESGALQLTVLRQQIDQIIRRRQDCAVAFIQGQIAQTEQGITHGVGPDQQILFQTVMGKA